MNEEVVLLSAPALADLADQLNETKKKRLAADKVANELKAQEVALHDRLLLQMQKQDISAIGGQTVRVELKREPDYMPHVTNWPEFYSFIINEEDFSLLERRPSRAAMKERWEAGVEVPGVEKFPIYKLGMSQVKG